VERADVQGLALYAYKEHRRSRFYRLRFDAGQPREWLRRVLTDVTSGTEDRDGEFRFNVAFSARGLVALGLDDSDLVTFSREFTQGMAHQERSDVLGDVDQDAPEHWEFGNAAMPLHGLAMLYAKSDEQLAERGEGIEQLLERYGIEYQREDVSLPEDSKEHFGFTDGLAQPFIRGSGRRRPPGELKLATGELLLGYVNAYGQIGPVPSTRVRRGMREHPFPIRGTQRVAFGYNGTYLVLRKLQQRVGEFWSYCWDAAVAEQAPNVAERAKLIAARFVGRWPNGVPLVHAPEREPQAHGDLNDFGFRELDPHGLRCPIGAHVRRANPRDMFGATAEEGVHDTNLHRIVRRGRGYGPKLAGAMPRVDDGVERGLYFVALNANLRRQFEFIQQTWLNSCKFAGLSAERDPLVGKDAFDFDDQKVPRTFSAQRRPVRDHYQGLPKFVRVRGGEYLFLPGLRALNYLCVGGD
jgi:Dyp-type peroxidase family